MTATIKPTLGIDPRIERAFQKQHGFSLESQLLMLAVMGSHSHGTYLAPTEPTAVDDIDLMGFVVPPLDYHLGLGHFENWSFKEDQLDVIVYSLEKAVRLLLKGNPNIVGALWLRPEYYPYRHPLFDQLIGSREVFSSLATATAFAGYAYGQLKRMEAFNLDRMEEYERLTAEITAHGPLTEVLEADSAKLKHIVKAWSLSLEVLNRFRALHRNYFSGYMGEKRKGVVRQFGYDVKNAAHLIRLLRMGTEFLQTGVFKVYRVEDAAELIAIKRGEWSLDQVKAEAEACFGKFREAEANPLLSLPRQPNEGIANDLLVGIQCSMLDI